MDNLVFSSVKELAAGILNRQVSSVEVVEAHLAQIERHNPQLNVIVTRNEEQARARAREADLALARGEIWGPLHGVPITIKDGFATAGIRTTSGFPPFADFVPEVDAPVVARLRAAGAILLGKTNLPTFSLDTQTDNPLFGRTNNPWDLSRTSGGSTGGAAAVAAGLSPLELGADLGGSLRIPAHCCGVYSLKPTDYRLPGGGYHPSPQPEPPDTGGPAQLSVAGPLARSVDDLVLAFQIMAGADTRQWAVPPVPVEALPVQSLGQLRLAWIDDFGGVPVDAETRAVIAGLAANLAQAGVRMERCLPEAFDFTEIWETWGELVACALGQNPGIAALLGASETAVDATARGLYRGLRFNFSDYQASLVKRSTFITDLEVFFEQWDALICPVMSVPAFKHCPKDTPIFVEGQPVPYWTATISYTCPFNLTGHPVVVLPAGHTRSGLPLGLQVVGRRWGEMPLLAIAKSLVGEVEGFRRPPGY